MRDLRPLARLMCVTAALLTPVVAPAVANAEDVETALVGPANVDILGVPHATGVLSPADVARYRQIFELQEAGEWTAAASLIDELTNPVLLGHVQAQKYLHPTKYRSKFRELRDWLSVNADHPQAKRIYSLAVRRMPAGAKRPRGPVDTRFHSSTVDPESPVVALDLTRSQHRRASQIRREISARVRRGWPTGALEVLNQKQSSQLLSATQIDDARRDIARGYFRAGKDAEALAVADAAAANTGLVPLTHWWGGLAAWRLGDIESAQFHFSALAASRTASDWNVAAGAYWAARAYLVGREPSQVNQWLSVGAAYPFTFYGVLARRALALDLDYDWRLPELGSVDLRQITAADTGERAVALLQVGRYGEAEAELRSLAGADPTLIPAVTALATRTSMPSLSHRLGTRVATPVPLPAAMFPLPHWTPVDGFQADRALIYAFMRQESAFNVRAKSPVGARGLMQLMPRTASFIGRQRSLTGSQKHTLFEPEFNMSLGQRYVNFLLEDEVVDGDLFRLAVAYNAGPGNLRRWMRKVDYQDDPLLFIETLPTRETRLFVERVLTNLWVYRHRLGQETPSLDAVVAGQWPSYSPQDGTQTANRGLTN